MTVQIYYETRVGDQKMVEDAQVLVKSTQLNIGKPLLCSFMPYVAL